MKLFLQILDEVSSLTVGWLMNCLSPFLSMIDDRSLYESVHLPKVHICIHGINI